MHSLFKTILIKIYIYNDYLYNTNISNIIINELICIYFYYTIKFNCIMTTTDNINKFYTTTLSKVHVIIK